MILIATISLNSVANDKVSVPSQKKSYLREVSDSLQASRQQFDLYEEHDVRYASNDTPPDSVGNAILHGGAVVFLSANLAKSEMALILGDKGGFGKNLGHYLKQGVKVAFIADNLYALYVTVDGRDPTLSPGITWALSKTGIIDPQSNGSSVRASAFLYCSESVCKPFPTKEGSRCYYSPHSNGDPAFASLQLFTGISEIWIAGQHIFGYPMSDSPPWDGKHPKILKKLEPYIVLALLGDGLMRLNALANDYDPTLSPAGTFALDQLGFVNEKTGDFKLHPLLSCDLPTLDSPSVASRGEDRAITVARSQLGEQSKTQAPGAR